MTQRTRTIPILVAALLAALAAGVLAVVPGSGSSHREAPLTSIDPTADDTDVYAFTADDATDALTVVANWIPFEDPAGGPNFYRFDDRARTTSTSTTPATASYDVRYRFKFKDEGPQPELVPVRAAGRELDRRPEAERRADVLRSRARPTGTASATGVQACSRSGLPVAPEQRRPEDVPELRRGRQRRRSQSLPGGGKVFAGQRRRPVLRRPRRDVRRDQLPQRHRQRRAAARTTSPATTSTRSCCRCPRRTSPRTASRSPDAAAERRRRRVGLDRAPGAQVIRRAQARARASRPGLPPRQPARQRGRHPAREEGLLQPTQPDGRRAELRQVRASSRSWRRS